MYHLKVLDGVDLRADAGGALTDVITQPKRLGLLSYLVLNRGPVRRDKLLALFWPEADDKSARNALNQAVHHLRRGLGADAVVTRGAEDVSINPTLLHCDAVAFEVLLDSGQAELALDLYRRPLLDGFHVADAPDFNEWLETERRRLQDAASRAARGEVARALEQGEPVRALELARRARQWANPFDESALRDLLNVYDAVGDRAAALRLYDEFAERLNAEYGVEPAPETRAMMESIRARAEPDFLPERARLARSNGPLPAPAQVLPFTRRAHTRMAAAVVVGIGALWAGYRTVRPNAAELNPRAIAVFPVVYHGAPEHQYVAEGLTGLVAANLSASGVAQSVDPRAIGAFLTRENLATVTQAQAREIAQRFGSGRAVLAEITESGGRLRLIATVVNANRRWGNAEISINGEVNELFDLADRASVQLLTEMDASDGARPVRSALQVTSSLAALRAYLQGEADYRAGRFGNAVDSYRRAVDADSTFALAQLRLSMAANWVAQSGLADVAAGAARRHSNRLSPADRERVRAWSEYLAGAADLAQRRYRALLAADSTDLDAILHLADIQFHWGPMLGVPIGESVGGWQRLLRFDPRNAAAWIHLARAAAMTGDRTSFDSAAIRLESLDPAADRMLELRLLRAFAFGDSTQQRHAAAGLATAEHIVETLEFQAAAASYDLRGIADILVPEGWKGRGFQSRPFGQVVLKTAANAGRGKLGRAFADADSGAHIDPSRAHELRAHLAALPLPIEPALRRAMLADLVRNPTFANDRPMAAANRAYQAGLLAVQLGDTAYARRQADWLDTVRTGAASDSAYAAQYANLIRAELLRSRRLYQQALQVIGAPAMLPDSRVPFIFSYHKSHERFLRAELHAALGQNAEAVRWFSTFPDAAATDLVYVAPAQLRLADLYERSGQFDAAARHLARFIALWSDADAALQPIVRGAQARLGELRSR